MEIKHHGKGMQTRMIKNYRNNDYEKAIVPIDHQATVAAKRKEKKCPYTCTISDENMEVDSSFD